MAHHGEAQGVIEKFQLKKMRPDLWKSDDMLLIITGEGPFEAATRTALEISCHPVKEIINLGIAGTLSGHQMGEFLQVRTLYLAQDLKPMFKTFTVSSEGEDCVTSFERILDPEKSKTLRGLGTLVDREAWGVAMAAKTAGIPLRVFKVVSDDAGSLGACEIVKEKAEELSIALAHGLMRILAKESPVQEISTPEGFHFTFSHKHKFQTLLTKLSIKLENTPELPLDEIRGLDISPKEKTKRLIEWMEDEVDPVRKILNHHAEKIRTTFHSHGLEVKIDPLWENPKLSIVVEASDDSELHAKADALKRISITPFSEIMKGNFHVE